MEEIAEVYARALFEVATEHDKLDLVRDELGQFADALADSRELQTFLFSPYFSTEEKKDGLHKAVTGADESVANFLELLLENHRMPELFRMRREYDTLWERYNRRLPVSVTSAVELDEQTVSRIGDRIAEQTGQTIELDPSIAERIGDEIGRQTGRTVQLTSTVDPDVIGGIVLRVGNSILDASIRNRLENLRKQVVKA